LAELRAQVALPLLKAPMKDAEVAVSPDISSAQVKTWLQRLIDDGVLESRKCQRVTSLNSPPSSSKR